MRQRFVKVRKGAYRGVKGALKVRKGASRCVKVRKDTLKVC